MNTRLLTMVHWMQGGTGLTNLSGDTTALVAAMEEYGNPLLVIHDRPFGGGSHMVGWKSLHWLGDKRTDLSVFWELVRLNETELKLDAEGKSRE